MAASKTKTPTTDSSRLQKSVQLIVFAPVNADPNDEESRIYMVCPASLKVVEVVDKYDDDAITYLSTLGNTKKKNEIPPSEFSDDLGREFEGEIEVAGEVVEQVKAVKELLVESDDLTSIEDELDDDVVTFASASLDDIFPDDSDPEARTVSDVDMADALALLDQEDDDSDLVGLTDFVDDDSLPEL